MGSQWKSLGASVVGTSHGTGGVPCQDRFHLEVWTGADESVLLVACADGAGSAECAEVGAEHACRSVIATVRRELDACGPGLLESVADDPGRRRGWFGQARADLFHEAETRGVPPRELACTLLLALVGERSALFAQIGDGAIVIGDGAGADAADDATPTEPYRLVFQPESGEYINETWFLIHDNFADHVQVTYHAVRIDELAMMSDGLQGLALDMGRARPHAPFFSPMFAALRDRASGSLQESLVQFLGSPRVNARTDDDKTLILASRQIQPGSESDHEPL